MIHNLQNPPNLCFVTKIIRVVLEEKLLRYFSILSVYCDNWQIKPQYPERIHYLLISRLECLIKTALKYLRERADRRTGFRIGRIGCRARESEEAHGQSASLGWDIASNRTPLTECLPIPRACLPSVVNSVAGSTNLPELRRNPRICARIAMVP